MSRNRKKGRADEHKFFARIVYRTESWVTREADPDDDWDCDDTDNSYSFFGYVLVEKTDIWDFSFKSKPEGPLDLVYVLYSTGDSFHSEDNRMEMIALKQHHKDAVAIQFALEEDYKTYKAAHDWKFQPLKIRLPSDDSTLELSTSPWKGYFEHLNGVHIQRLTLGELYER